LRNRDSPYVVGLRDIPPEGLERRFDLSGDFARAALTDTEATVDDAKISAVLELQKTGVEVLARGHIASEVTLVCSRCAGPARVALTSPVEVLFLPRDADPPEAADSPDLMAEDAPDIVAYEGQEIDLEETLREEVLLSLPYAPLCREDCKGLCGTCGKDLNEGPCDCGEAEKDQKPGKFASLRNLKI